LEAW